MTTETKIAKSMKNTEMAAKVHSEVSSRDLDSVKGSRHMIEGKTNIVDPSICLLEQFFMVSLDRSLKRASCHNSSKAYAQLSL